MPGPICTDDVRRRNEAVCPLEIQFMKANRRTFVSTALGGGLAALPLGAADSPPPSLTSAELNARYRKLDEILKQPVLKKQLFSTPVIMRIQRHDFRTRSVGLKAASPQESDGLS